MTDAAGAPLPRLAGYRWVRPLGAGGGRGEVHLAVREADGASTVIKLLRAGARVGPGELARFASESALLSGVDHPHVVRIRDHGAGEGHAWIAMEHFAQGDLRTELAAGMARPRVLQVLQQMAQALDAIHRRGIIHRDLKPANIMRRADGSVVLADFGIATAPPVPDTPAARAAAHIGTPYYLSPEQASGQPLTAASDWYSLGITAFEMLAGARPFQATSLRALLEQHRSASVPRLPPAYADLQNLVARLLAKAPGDRLASAAALQAALAPFERP